MSHEPIDHTTSLRWVTLALCAATIAVGWPLLPALVLSAWTAQLARPLRVRLEHALRGRRRAATAATLLLFGLLAVPVLLLSLGVLSGVQQLALALSGAESMRSALEALASEAESSSLRLPTSLDEVIALAQEHGAQVLQLGSRIAGAAVKGSIALLIYFGGVYSLLMHGEETWAWLRRHAPIDADDLAAFGRAFHETGRGLIFGVGLTMATQGLVATTVYMILGVPRAWVLGPLTGVVAVIPVVGTTLVWGPIAIGLFLTGDPTRAIILTLLGLLVISSIDNLLRPLFTRLGALKLPVLLVFVSILGGLATLGPTGAIFGPLIVRLATEALALHRQRQVPSAPHPPTVDAEQP